MSRASTRTIAGVSGAPSLSNCYIPSVAGASGETGTTTTRESKSQRQQRLSSARFNGDGQGRDGRTLRRLLMETNVLGGEGDGGSSLVEWGHTKILCHVGSPTSTDGQLSQVEEGVVSVKVEWAPHFGMPPIVTTSGLDDNNSNRWEGMERRWRQQQEVDFSNKIETALKPALKDYATRFPKCVLPIHVTILQDDGSALSACLVAASLALVDASLELYDFVTSCTVTRLGDELLVDPTWDELEVADATLLLAMMPQWKEVTLWHQSGCITQGRRQQDSEALDLCREACKRLHKMMRECVIRGIEQKQGESNVVTAQTGSKASKM